MSFCSFRILISWETLIDLSIFCVIAGRVVSGICEAQVEPAALRFLCGAYRNNTGMRMGNRTLSLNIMALNSLFVCISIPENGGRGRSLPSGFTQSGGLAAGERTGNQVQIHPAD